MRRSSRGMSDAGLPELLPRPDPTRLSTEQVRREILSLRENLEQQLAVLRAEMMGHWTLDDERWAAVGRQLARIESIRLEQKADTAISIDAALGVVNRENVRIEANSIKLIEAERAANKAVTDGLNQQTGSLRDRVIAMESVRRGGFEYRNAVYAALAGIVSLVAIASLLIPLLVNKTH